MLYELDSNRVHEIVVDVFQRKGVAPPYSIEFEHRKSADSRPRAYLEGKTLHVIASTEPELKRLIGRFVVRNTWTPHDWLLVNHVGLYALTSAILLTTLPAISYQLTYLFPDFRVWIVIATSVSIVVFSIWTSNQVMRRSVKLLRDFTIEMADLECMTEYDAKDYTGDSHLTIVAGSSICMIGALVSGSFSNIFYSQEVVLIVLPCIVLLLAALCLLYSQAWTSIGSNLCYQTDESDDEDEEMEVDKFEDNEFLQGAFKNLIQRMDLWKSLSSKHNEEFGEVRARFFEIRYAQCRAVHDYVKEGTLYIDAEDLNEDAARRLGAAILALGSLRFYMELSLKRRAIHLVAFVFGLVMLMVALVAAYGISKEFGIGALLFTGILFIGMWYVGWTQNEEVRRDFPHVLRKTEVLKEYEVDLYSDLVFSYSSRFELALLVGFLVAIIVLGCLILVSA